MSLEELSKVLFFRMILVRVFNSKSYIVMDLIRACKDGSYRTVIDILDHPRNSVGPNDYNDVSYELVMEY